MAGHRAFEHQYFSKENVMKAKFALEFPNQDSQVFESRFAHDRNLADASGRGIDYDGRRFMSEKATWMAFWPAEEFPGTQPPSEAEISQSNAQHAQDQPHNTSYHRGRGGQGHDWGGGPRRGPGRRLGGGGARSNRGGRSYNAISANRGGGGRAYSSGGIGVCKFWLRGYCKSGDACHFVHPPPNGPSNGDGARREDPNIGFRSSDQNEPSSSDHEGFLIDIDDEASTTMCLQCGVTGHAEMSCPYQVVVKQGVDRERRLICGTLGHKSFKFGSQDGCAECKGEKEHNEAPTIETQRKDTEVIVAKAAARGWAEPQYSEMEQSLIDL